MLFGSPLNNEPFNHEQRKQLIHCKTWYEITNGEKKVILRRKRLIVHTNLSLGKRWVNETIDYAKFFVSSLKKWQKLKFL